MKQLKFKTIKEALSQPESKNFWISYENGKFDTGNKTSFYSRLEPDEHLTFDISNNKVLVNVGYNGSLKYVTVFRGEYLCDTGHIWPGVWVHKDFTKYGPYSFTIKLGEKTVDLANCDWSYKTSLLGNIFPITEFTEKRIKATVVTYAPISRDGTIRPRGVVYGLFIENISNERLSGSVILPEMFRRDNVPSSYLEAGLNCYRDMNMSLLDVADKKTEVDFDLAHGQNIWVPVLLYSFGDPTLEEIESKGSLSWLNETWSYFKGMTGELSMPEDDFTAELFERSVHQCFHCIGMDGTGKVNGSNWGSYPVTMQIWMQDLFYSFMPFYMLEPGFLKKGILWFTEYSLRPKGVEFEGGVSHSICNALSPAQLAGLYYSSTGDKDFFLQNPMVIDKAKSMLEELISIRKDKTIWLFSSKFISDGLSAGDYHTGTNLTVWYSFLSVARIIREVYGDYELADSYETIAGKIKEALDMHNICEGPFGKQYIEGTNADGSIPWMGHEGEESDTTLMPLYGYLDYDDVQYKNYTKFAMSEHNLAYSKVTKGIKWGGTLDPLPVQATFPGYITGLMNTVDRESMVGESGYMTEIRRLTDIDGSLWWWPYAGEAPEYGKTSRKFVTGKCGWSQGLFASMFINQILGLKYDAPARSLFFRPFSPSSSFTWNYFRLGGGFFSVSYSRSANEVELSILNYNNYKIRIEMEIMLEGTDVKIIKLNGKESSTDFSKGRFLGRHTVKYTDSLQSNELKSIKVIEV